MLTVAAGPMTLQSCSKAGVLKRLRDARVLLVDEISMLSPTLLEVLYASSLSQLI